MMSWIFGLTTKDRSCIDKIAKIKKILPSNYNLISDIPHHIFFGESDNLIYSENLKYIIRGFGLRENDDNYSWMNKEVWDDYLINKNYEEPSGQYLILKWDENEISFLNDYFGINTLYIYKIGDYTYFSTRLDYLCSVIDFPELNMNIFSGRWILFNQISTKESVVKGIQKLPPNSIITIKNNQLICKSNKLKFKEIDRHDFVHDLNKLCNVELPPKYKISLGLSGGLDSRVLLECLLESNREFIVHSFGKEDDKDVVIASDIASSLGLEHHLLDYNLQPEMNSLEEYVILNEVVDTVATYLITSGIYKNNFSDKVLMDGAGGELYRRQFLNRLVLRGRGSLKSGNRNTIFRYFKLFRADIFDAEICEKLYYGAMEQISSITNDLNKIKINGLENFVDVLSAMTRFPNYYGPEQNRLNSYLLSYMPFVDKKLFSALTLIPLEKRRNNKMFYQIIRDGKNKLNSFDLVKDGVSYPFGLNTFTIYSLTKIKKKLFGIKRNSLVEEFYIKNKESVMDVLNSSQMKNSGFYDLKKVDRIISDAYSGDNKNSYELDWLFSFELFRKGLRLSY